MRSSSDVIDISTTAPTMTDPDASVYVVDDDVSVCTAVGNLIRSVGWRVGTFHSAQAFLKSPRVRGPSCLVLDVNMPGFSGLELQQALIETNVQIPIIFVTGIGDIPMSVRAIKAGAQEFLTKPLKEDELISAIRAAFDLFQQLDVPLTPRERSVLTLIGRGQSNKSIAHELAIAPQTVKSHVKNIFGKLGSRTRAECITQAAKLGLV